jgi:NAD+ kinase
MSQEDNPFTMPAPPFSCVVTASQTAAAQEAKKKLLELYPLFLHDKKPTSGDIIVALGGDGFMLRTLKNQRRQKNPIFGLNLGHLGFLMNPWQTDNLVERIQNAVTVSINPLKMTAVDKDNQTVTTHAYNEVTLFRQTNQSSHLHVHTNDEVQLQDLKGDGIIIATPAGSPAYNYSARGPILPIESKLLALTPVNAFHPRGWRGAVLHHYAQITISVLNSGHRPVIAIADTLEVPDVTSVHVEEDPSSAMNILFEPHHDIRSRLIKQQFQE